LFIAFRSQSSEDEDPLTCQRSQLDCKNLHFSTERIQQGSKINVPNFVTNFQNRSRNPTGELRCALHNPGRLGFLEEMVIGEGQDLSRKDAQRLARNLA